MSTTLGSAAGNIRIFKPATAKGRLPALDGIRGILAAIVALAHALSTMGIDALNALAPYAVWGFFMLSGCVLSRAWDGKWGIFLVRRLIRLWPVHLACLGLAVALNGASVHAIDLLLFPWFLSSSAGVYVVHLANPPTWSLCVEVASIPFMPVIALCGRCGLVGFLAGIIFALVMTFFVHPACLNLVFFFTGAAFSQLRALPIRPLETALPQWLGRISYSLYLVHAPVFVCAAAWLGPKGPLLTLPVTLAAAWLVWRLVERPSIAWSKRVRPAQPRPLRILSLPPWLRTAKTA